MQEITIQFGVPQSLLVAFAGPVVAAFSLAVAALAFLKNSRASEFQICLKLSEQIGENWSKYHKLKRSSSKLKQLGEILDHYERCAMFINDYRLFPGRSVINLSRQVKEALRANWDHDTFRQVFESNCSSADTYCEISRLMRSERIYLRDPGS